MQNIEKKLDGQLADVKKQLHENCKSFKSNNEFLHYNNKTPPTTPIQWAKGTAGVPCFTKSMKTDCQEQNRIQLKSGFSEDQIS